MTSEQTREWVAPPNARLPDFIICGAMKCGTSTVHKLLNRHPRVYIPTREIHFFDIDDIFGHTDFYFQDKSRWVWPNIASNPQGYWAWYQSFFEQAPENCLLGEDSTFYLSSPKASLRISLQSKPIKTIICLRQPTLRAYSQYWHMLRTGRALFNFDDTLKYTPTYVLQQSMYLEQIRDFMEHIPRERIFFFILEEFLAEKEHTIKNLAHFLSLPYEEFPNNVLDTHSNKGRIPRSITLQVLKNRTFRSFGNVHYVNKLPFRPESMNKRGYFLSKLANKIYGKLNISNRRSTPVMNPSTRAFLDDFFQRELAGLGDIVGSDLEKLWFGN